MMQKFQTRTIQLDTENLRDVAINMVKHMPLGTEVVGREKVKVRKQSQNDLMWSGPLKDIEQQAWMLNRKFSDAVWHEYFKGEYLPEADDPELHLKVKDPETYLKWDITPGGDRVCVGSTTELTVAGFSEYLEQVYAFGAGLGVLFTASKRGGL